MVIGDSITVCRLNLDGDTTLNWTDTLVKHRNTCVVIQALFGLQEKLDIGHETHERPGHFTE